jgi:DNA processing protein
MLLEWLELVRLPGISVARKRALIERYQTPGEILQSSAQSLKQTGIVSGSAVPLINRSCEKQATQDYQSLENISSKDLSCGFIPFNSADFPNLLNEIPAPPLGIFYFGNYEFLEKDQIAIVGSRNASPAGLKTAKAFSRELSILGLTVTSGMAAGIDKAAHEGALDSGFPTIAVMGTGIDRIYPRSHTDLYESISSNGVIVTEFPPGVTAQRSHFPRRNRIISGLSHGTLVVEAGIRSGSLITARLAGEQGREVFAIPGSIHMPTSRGCHKLIRDGAKLVEGIDDIIEELPTSWVPRGAVQPRPEAHTDTQCDILIYSLIDYAPTPLECLIQESGMSAEMVLSQLLELELDGKIAQTPNGYQKLPVVQD